jgi:glycosyltransferase involved in cell wall biosynthesis
MASFDFSQFRNSAAISNPAPIQQPEGLVAGERWDDDSITYVTVTQDRIFNNKRNFPIVLPYVDRAVVVDGFSKDGTADYLRSLGPKVEVFQREWDDSFANQYNEYLRHIRGGWVLLMDDDEVPSEGMLRSLRDIVKHSEKGTKFDTVEFRSNDITYHEGDWANRVDNGPCEYYRQVFYKWNPNLRYAVHLHQALVGLRGPVARTKEHYYHIKSTKDELRNACRNYFISGEWPSHPVEEGIKTPEWFELKQILSEKHPEVKVFSQLNGLLVSKQVCPEIVQWAFKYRTHNQGVEGESAGELRAYARYLDMLGYKA